MKLLPIERLWTGDGYGQNDAVTHTQIQRCDIAAIYSVKTKEGKIKGYETFIITKRMKGQPLPGGMFEKEDREVYPSANSFGKTAWSFGNLTAAQNKYDEVIAEHNAPKVVVEKKQYVPTGKPRGKARIERPTLVIPSDKFTMEQLEGANPNGWNRALIYIEIQKQITNGKVKQIGKVESQTKGKKAIIYSLT